MSDDPYLGQLEELYVAVMRRRRDLRPSDRIREDLGVDSMAALQLLVGLEEELDVALLDDARLKDVETVGQLTALVAAAVAEARRGQSV